MNSNQKIQDGPEIITEEYKDNWPYSLNHFYQHEDSYCKKFGCGRRLTLTEALYGHYCRQCFISAAPVDVTKFVRY